MDAKRSGVLFKTMCRKILYTSRICGIIVRHVLNSEDEDIRDGGVESQRVITQKISCYNKVRKQ
jgi:hypothetical protein